MGHASVIDNKISDRQVLSVSQAVNQLSSVSQLVSQSSHLLVGQLVKCRLSTCQCHLSKVGVVC